VSKLAYAKSQKEFDTHWDEIRATKLNSVIEYLELNWLPIKNQWVACFKDEALNLGENTNIHLESTFQHLRSGADKIKLLVIYRPPYSTAHRVTVATFLDEFANYLELIILLPEPLVTTGDMNIHLDDPNDSDAIKFLDLLDTYGLTQHINTPIHYLGYTLDLIVTRVSDALT